MPLVVGLGELRGHQMACHRGNSVPDASVVCWCAHVSKSYKRL